jgi:uncharacterized membrane protein
MKAVSRQVGVAVFSASAIAVGLVDLIWGAFDSDHQPIQAWGDNVPGRHLFAYILGLALVFGGAALLIPRSRRIGAILVGVTYFIFAIFWMPRLIIAPPIIGYTPRTYFGLFAGIGLEVIVVVAAITLYASVPPAALSKSVAASLRWAFALSSISFGLGHLTHIADDLIYVPAWLPPGRTFWVVFTGAAFVLAGIAIVARYLDALAARLLALMLLVFSAITLIPGLIAAPHDEVNWGGNFYNILAAASCWVFADWLASQPARATALNPGNLQQATAG